MANIGPRKEVVKGPAVETTTFVPERIRVSPAVPETPDRDIPIVNPDRTPTIVTPAREPVRV